MAIKLNLHQLEQEDLQLDGQLSAGELDLQLGGDILVHSADTLHYQLDATNAGEVVKAGADCVCVVSAVTCADDPEAAAGRLAEAVERASA